VTPYDHIAHIPQPDRTIVAEWCDRYRLGLDDYDDTAIFRLAARLYAVGRIPQTRNAVIDWKGRPLV
jgi:hypothetical protein